MSFHSPYGLSFRALTVLIEHIENKDVWPINVSDQPRTQCTQRLIERGFIRNKDSRHTTITRHGHKYFLMAAAAWADLYDRALNVKPVPANAAYAKKVENHLIAILASRQSGTLADRSNPPIPTERTAAL